MTRLAALLASLVLAHVAWPASQQTLGLDDLIDGAAEIVVGKVTGSAAHWQGRLIVTVSTVEVEEPLKGEPGGRIEITQLGGTAAHPVIGAPVTMSVSTFTALDAGERVLLFVDRHQPAVRQLVGAQQGKVTLRPDPAGTPRAAIGPRRLEAQRDAQRVTIASQAMSLDDLKARIRARLGGKP